MKLKGFVPRERIDTTDTPRPGRGFLVRDHGFLMGVGTRGIQAIAMRTEVE